MAIGTMSPQQLSAACSSDTPPIILDVRTRQEYEIARLESAILLPMDEIAGRLDEIPGDRDIVVLCHHGIRSMHVAMWLDSKGFSAIYNLTGGIDRWSLEVDPHIPRY